MATTSQYLEQLVRDKNNLITSLKEKGMTVDDNAKFTDLPSIVSNIQTGGGDLSEYFKEEIANGGNNASGFANTVIKLPRYTTIKGTSMEYLYSRFVGEQLDVSGLNTTGIKTMSYCFSWCQNLKNLDVSNFDTSEVTNFSYMFYGCQSLTELNVSNFDTSSATNMNNMFGGCKLLKNLDVSNFNTSKVTNFSNMFNSCTNLTELDVSNFDTSLCTTFSNMFNACSNLEKLDISNFSFSKVTSPINMQRMFYNCMRLKTLIIDNPNVMPCYSDTFYASSIANGAGYVYVPDDLVETYQGATNWSKYAKRIKPISELPTE